MTAKVVLDSPAPQTSEGGLAAEVTMGLLGELLSAGVTTVVALRSFPSDLDMPLGLSLVPRPAIVGGLTALGGRLSHGKGRAGYAMLGALPGTLISGAGIMLVERADSAAPIAVLLALGHVATIGGSVAAYRYSARRRMSERLERALRYAPSPMVDRQRGIAGLSLSGSF